MLLYFKADDTDTDSSVEKAQAASENAEIDMLSASDQNESKEGHTKGSDECSGDSVGGRKDKTGDIDKTSDSTELLTGTEKGDPDKDDPHKDGHENVQGKDTLNKDGIV